jgi:hypothetical protein
LLGGLPGVSPDDAVKVVGAGWGPDVLGARAGRGLYNVSFQAALGGVGSEQAQSQESFWLRSGHLRRGRHSMQTAKIRWRKSGGRQQNGPTAALSSCQHFRSAPVHPPIALACRRTLYTHLSGTAETGRQTARVFLAKRQGERSRMIRTRNKEKRSRESCPKSNVGRSSCQPMTVSEMGRDGGRPRPYVSLEQS